MNPSATWIEVRDVRVTLRRAGSGEPLLFLHGAGMTGRWLPIHQCLAQCFDVIAAEHPGFGETHRPAWFRGLSDMVLHYADLLDALELERVHVVGHSFGGRLAGLFASLFPHRVRTLTLIAPAPLEPGGTSQMPEWDPPGGDFDQLLFNGNKSSYPDYLDADDLGMNVADDGGDEFANPDAWSIDTPPSLYRQLARITAPSRVLIPDEDRIFPHSLYEQWASYLPGATVTTVFGRTHPTGHLMIVQEPEAIANEVALLAGVERFGGSGEHRP